MTRTSPPQVAFSSGEISPLLHRRFDYQRFQTGLATCRGFLPMAEGAVTRAPGTWYRGRTDSDAVARLIPFIFAADDAVVLEFTPGLMRVWRYGALVMDGPDPYELVTPYGADDLPNLRWVQSADVLYLVDGARPIQRLARFALDNWAIGPLVLNHGPFRVQNLTEALTLKASAATGSVTLLASAPLFTADHVGTLFKLQTEDASAVKYWQAAEKLKVGDRRRYDDNIYEVVAFDAATGLTGSTQPVTWTGGPPLTATDGNITWTKRDDGNPDAHTAWTALEYLSIGQRRYFPTADLTAEVTAIGMGSGPGSSTSPSRSVGTAPPLHSDGTWMAADGGVIWAFLSDNIGILRVTAVTDSTHATATVIRTVPADCIAAPTYRWSEAAWSPLYGYPSALELYEQRLVAAATPAEPRTTWFSAVGDFADFLDGTEADEAFAYTVAGNGSMNRIINLFSGRGGLHILALGEEFSTRSESRAQVIGPTTAVFGRDSGIGSSSARPIAPGGDPIFISRDRRRVHVISYSLEADANRAQDISRPSGHLGAAKFEEIVWQGVPLNTAWLRRGNGDLVAMVYDPAEEILGWAPVPVAGGVVESMAVTPASDGSLDILTLVVRRVIDGQTRRHIEEQALPFGALSSELAPSQACHLYAAQRFTPDPATNAFTLPHLIGQTVAAWTSEGRYEGLTVDDEGGVSLPWPVDWAVIGLFDDTHRIETLDITAQAPDGSTMGRQKRLHDRGGVGLHATAQLRVQSIERTFGKADVANPNRDLVQRPVGAPGADLFSGISPLAPPSGEATEVAYRFTPVGGAPATLTAMVPFVQEAGR